MTVDGRAVANFVLDYCDRKERSVTNLSLQKIVFFCQVWHLVERDKPLIRHKFEAWEYGPVLQYLYRDFKKFGNNKITERAVTLNRETGLKEVAKPEFDSETEALLGDVVNFYSQMTAGDLVRLTHIEGGPWHQVWNNSKGVAGGMRIDEQSMLSFYKTVQAPFTVQ